jgi:hypothetical protein
MQLLVEERAAAGRARARLSRVDILPPHMQGQEQCVRCIHVKCVERWP